MSTVLPENILKCLDPAERAKLGKAGVTASEAKHKWQTTQEKAMHAEVAEFVRLKGIGCYHCAMHRRATIRAGMPDFGLLYNRKGIAIELKAPGGILSTEQAECIAELRLAHVPVKVCYSSGEAIDFIIAELLT